MGAKMTCPYCNGKDTISIIYLYRYNDNNTFVKKDSNEVKYSDRKRKPKRKNYDGTLITDHNHNKYCKEYNKSFNSGRNLYAIDINNFSNLINLLYSIIRVIIILDKKIESEENNERI